MKETYSSIKGIYRDVLKDQNNNIIFDSGWVSNLIVDNCRKLLAAFMKNDGPLGIQYLKVGQGDPDWDTHGAPAPNALLEGLENPDSNPIEAPNLEIVYLNDQDAEVPGPTPRLQITATLGIDIPSPPAGSGLSTYPLREFGLFGLYGSEEYMIDCIRHPVIHKDVSSTLIRVVRLYF